MGKKERFWNRKDPIVEPEVQTQDPPYYEEEKGTDPKMDFEEQRDKLINHPDFERLDDQKKQAALGMFFDQYGTDYLNQSGVDDPDIQRSVKTKWMASTFNGIKGVVPEPIEPEKKNQIEREPIELPDWLTDGATSYQEVTQPVDNLRITPARTPENEDAVKAHREELETKIPAITEELLNTDDFGYIKSRPDLYYQGGEKSVKEVDKWLKDNSDLEYRDRKYIHEYLNKKSKDEMTEALRGKYQGDLATDSQEAAQTFTEDYEPGTFLDPETDERIEAPKTKEDAEFASLLDKYSNEMTSMLIAADNMNPIAQERNALDAEYATLEEEGKALRELANQEKGWLRGMAVKSVNNVLEQKKDLNFIQRILDPNTVPSLDRGDGTTSTHSMEYGEADGKYYVYPSVVERDGKLVDLYAEGEDPFKYAMDNNEFIEFKTEDEAALFSSDAGYKQYWYENGMLERPKDMPEIPKGKNDEEYMKNYSAWITEINTANSEYIKKLDAFNEKTNEFNATLKDIPKEIPNSKTLTERLTDHVQGSYLRWQHYEDAFNTATRQYRGEEESLKIPSTKTLAQLNKLRYQSKAEFIAGSRMLYNQEGPLQIDRDDGYKAELFGTAALRSIGYGKKGENESYFDEPMQKEILGAMYGVGKDVGVEFSDEEMEAFTATAGEGVVTGLGTLAPNLPELFILGGTSGVVKGALNLGKWTKGYQIIKNSALGKAAVIGLDQTPSSGWAVVRMFKPTRVQKAVGTVASGLIDEAIFTGGGFQFGAITGMNAAHGILPDVKFKGRWQMLNPIVDMVVKSGVGATVGMEAGMSTAGLVEGVLSDRPVDDIFNELYPSVTEASKRILEEFTVNSLLFGGQGAIMKGAQKSAQAPAGLQFNKFGNMNWTGYLNPRVRDRYYKAAKEFESKGFTDTATELYKWLDIYKDPIQGSEIKEERQKNLKTSLEILPDGQLREMREVYELGIKALEYQGRQPDFDGKLEVPIRTYGDVKEGSVVSTKEYRDVSKEGEDPRMEQVTDHWEVTKRQDAGNGAPVRYEAINTETGEQRIFEPKLSDVEGKKTSYFEFDPTMRIELKNSLQVPFTLEGFYEHYNAINSILSTRDINPKAVLPPGPSGPQTPPGVDIPIPPPMTKIERKREQITQREKELQEETGMEPLALPEAKKEYSYGDPEAIIGVPTSEFSANLANRQGEMRDQLEDLDKKEKDLQDQIAKELQGRDNRIAREEARNEIIRTRTARDKIENKFDSELSEWLDKSKPILIQEISKNMAGASQDEMQEILDELWPKMVNPTDEEVNMTIGELVKQTINEKATEGEGTEQPVQPTKTEKEGKPTEAPKEGVPEEVKPEEDLVVEKKGDKWVVTQYGDTVVTEEFDTEEKAREFAEGIKVITGGKITYAEKKAKTEAKKKQQEKEAPTEYRYIMRARPFDIGTYPKEGFVRYVPEGSKFGTVIYDRKMPIEEFKKWDFIPETELQEAVKTEYTDEYHERIVPEWKGTVVTVKMYEKATDAEPVGEMDLASADFLTNVQTGYFTPRVEEPTVQKVDIDLLNNISATLKINYPDEYKDIGLTLDLLDHAYEKGQDLEPILKQSGFWKLGINEYSDLLKSLNENPEETLNGLRDTLTEQIEAKEEPKSPGESMRERGQRTVNGVEYKRQESLEEVKTPLAKGKGYFVAFAKKENPKVEWAVIEAGKLQPSHMTGTENPRHFIPEAQPRNRASLKALADAAREKAMNLDPEQLHFSPNAYSGAPVVNHRGEVIQGNGRGEAIIYYYSTTAKDPKGYKKMIKEQAESLGLDPTEIKKFKEPVLVRMITAPDEVSIMLGNYGMRDLEDVQEETADIKQASNRMDKEQGVVISNILLKGNEADDTLNDLIRKNSDDLITKLVEFDVFKQGDAEKFRKGGDITPQGIKAVEGVIKGLFFKGGNQDLPEIFGKLSHIIKTGVEKSIPILLRIPMDQNILPQLRNAIMGIYEYDNYRSNNPEGNFRDWVDQGNMFEDPISKRFSPLELAIIKNVYEAKRQGDIVRMFAEYEKAVKGSAADLFKDQEAGISRAEATVKVFGQEYVPTIDDKYEKATEVPTGSEGKKPDREPEKGKGAEEEPPIQKVDVKNDLDDMVNLLGDLDFDNGPVDAAGGESSEGPKIKMLNIATGIVSKMTDAGIYGFEPVLTEIIPALPLPKLQQLLPFIKQGYVAHWAIAPQEVKDQMSIQVAGSYDNEDLDQLIANMNKPVDPDTFEDIMDKRFFVPAVGRFIEVLRIEELNDPEDQKIEMMGGLFGELPAEFEKMQVAILKDDMHTGMKYGVDVSVLRKSIDKGEIKEVPPYDNPQWREQLQPIIDHYKKVGDLDTAAKLEKQLTKEPVISLKKEGTWEDEIKKLQRKVEFEKKQDDIISGKVMFDPIEVDLFTEDDVWNIIEGEVKRGEPLTPYIKELISQETIDRLVDLHNQVRELYSKLGLRHGEVPYYLKTIQASGMVSGLYPVGAKARALAREHENASQAKVDDAVKWFHRNLDEAFAKLAIAKENALTWDIKHHIWNGLKFPKDKYAGIVDLAKKWGITNKAATRDSYEMALVEIANTMALDHTKSPLSRYSNILNLYTTTPNISLTARTGEVKELQQYSTPVPIAYLMGHYVNSGEVDSFMEPQAGIGALLIGAKKGSVRANEIDQRRFEKLISQGYSTLSHDSNHGLKGRFDLEQFAAMGMNPPFGGPVEDYHGYPLKGEYVPVAYNLEQLADHGKAAILVGGHIKFDDIGRMKKDPKGGGDLPFFNWLGKHFNIDDVIQIPGEFYRGMGAEYPVKLILINGRKAAPQGAAPLYSEMFDPIEPNEWSNLQERIFSKTTKPNEKSVLQSKVDAERGSRDIVGGADTPGVPTTEVPGPAPTVPGETDVPPATTTTGESKKPDTGLPERDPRRVSDGPGGPDIGVPGIPKSTGGTKPQVGGQGSGGFGKIQSKRNSEDLPVRDIGKPTERTKRELGLTERSADDVTPYIPLSIGNSGKYVIPHSIANAVEEALMELKAEIGDVDQFVQDKLNYPGREVLHKVLFAEQIDGVAQAIYNIEIQPPQAMIIGHQTGAGKGRIAMGVAAYAIENGKIPVVITKEAGLFSDFFRDLIDIGKPDYKPFIMNRQFNDSPGKVKIFNLKTGAVLHEVDTKENLKVIGKGVEPGTWELPEDVDMVFTTYSQFQNEKTDIQKRGFLMNLARTKDVVFIMDESHGAAGQSNTGQYFMDWLQETGGGVFLSATYAKRPDNMPLYAMKSVLQETNMEHDSLIDAIAAGGPALQEIITTQLAEAGQFNKLGMNLDATYNYLFIGDNDQTQRTYNPELGEEMVRKYDLVTEVLRDIIDFQSDFVKGALSAMDEAVKKEGKIVTEREGTSKAGISNTPYFSRIWNIIDQLLLSLKVEEIIPLVIEDLKKGIKPVIALRSTMEAVFDEMYDDGKLEKNQVIDMDFSYILKRGMGTVMKYTEKDEKGVGEKKFLRPEDLTELGRQKYFDLMEKIERTSTGIPLSPIDVLKKGLADAGYKPLEVTGRDTMFELSDDLKTGKYVNNDRPNKIQAVSLFNNNPDYVIVANEAISTGLSLHPHIDFNDTNPRTMYYPQQQLNINTAVQTFGRIGRIGQLHSPTYNMVTSMLPAEQRMFMMMSKKLKSLDANTSGNQKQSSNMIEVPDFLNKYGDDVVVEFLKENLELNAAIGDPLGIEGAKDDTDIDKTNAAHRVSGRVQILPSEQQQLFNDEVVERYERLIEYLDSTGENDLMVTSEVLDAIFENSEVTIYGNGGSSRFGDDTRLNTADVNITKKPYTKAEVDAKIAEVPKNHVQDLSAAMVGGINDRITSRIQKLQERTEESKEMNRKQIFDNPKLSVDDKQREWSLKENDIDRYYDLKEGGIRDDGQALIKQFDEYLSFFYPGRVLEIPFTQTDQLGIVRMNKGVFIDFAVDMKKANPWVPSNFQLRFATLDSRKTFRIAASKPDHLGSIIGHSYHISEADQRDIRENWDFQKKGKDRETRYIVTGNILQGMNQYSKGRLIQFSMKDGTTNVGILMPENWKKPDINVYKVPITKSLKVIKNLLPTKWIEDYSGEVMIKKLFYSDPQLYELRVPASTKRGKKYYTNEALKGLIDSDHGWTQHGDRMVAIFPERNLEEILNVLDSRFKTVMEVDGEDIQDTMDQTDASAMEGDYSDGPRKKPKDRGGLSNPANDPIGTKSKAYGERIVPSPIEGTKPKPIDQILFDISGSLGGKNIRYRSKPGGKGTKAAGTHYPGTGLIVIKFAENMDVAAHEIGHYLDDLFGILGPESFDIWEDLKNELQHLWDYGSKPKRGEPNPELRRMKEGLAEFFRALVVNPGETKKRFPAAYSWVKERVSRNQKVWDGLLQFSDDVRVWHGSTNAQKIGTQMDLSIEDHRKHPLVFSRTNREGLFQTTIWDKLGNRLWFIYESGVISWKWAMNQRGSDIKDIKEVPPEDNFVYLVRNALGFDVKAQNVHEKGLIDFNNNRIIDGKTGMPTGWNLLFSTVPSYTWADYVTNLEDVLHYAAAYRGKEIPWKLAAKQARMDLSIKGLDKIPPIEILQGMDYNLKTFNDKIVRVMDMFIEGELTEEEAFFPKERYERFKKITIYGAAQEGMLDYNIAVGAVKEFEALETTDPVKHEWMTEFMRVYQEIGKWYNSYALEAGLINKRVYDQIDEENLHYLMFKRAFAWSVEGSVNGEDTSMAPYTVSNDPIPQIIMPGIMGSRKKIKHPVAELMGSVHHLLQMADHNWVIMSFARAFTGWRGSYEGPPSTIAEIADITDYPTEHGIHFKFKGESRWLNIEDKEVRRTFSNILKEMNPILKFISAIPRTLQKSIVTAIQFLLRNAPRDLGGYIVYGKDQKFQRLTKDLKFDTDMRDRFELSGGGQFGYVMRNKRGYMRMMRDVMIRAAKDPKKWLHNPWKWVQRAGDKYIHAASASERLTRMLQFKASVRKGLDEGMTPAGAYTYGAFNARDLTDFQAAGEYVKFLNSFIIFSGAAVRGLEKVVRSTREDPKRMAKRFSIYAMLPAIANSLLMWALADEDQKERYINLPDYIRDMFYVIPAGDGWILVPKPFELGALASVAQRAMDMWFLGDENAFSKEYLKNFHHLVNPYDISGVMGGFGGLIAAKMNYDFFRQKYIIPPREKELAVIKRNTETASRFGQHVQKLSDFKTPFKKDNPTADARVVDAFIKGQFAYWGEMFLKSYEGVTNIGKGEKIRRRWKFDLEDLALYKGDQVFSTPAVRWVLQTEMEYPDEMRYIIGQGFDKFQTDLHYYLSDEVQNNRKEMMSEGAYIRNEANLIREDIKQYIEENNTSLDTMGKEDKEYKQYRRNR